MADREEIQFLAVHYYQLQGLRAVPPGLTLLLVTLWANFTSRPSKTIYIPLLVVALGAALYWFIDRTYKNRFGQVRPKQEDRLRELLVQILAAALGLAAFWLDTRSLIPVSLIGLVFAGGFAYEFLRFAWSRKGSGRVYHLIFGAMIALVSLSPLLRMGPWWKAVGMRGQMVGVIVIVGLLVVAAGVVDHLYLRRSLPVEGR
ncbi:MAG: hypothetical protein R6U57_05610 [Anaerolineales bacterium]